jgi:hypothetical protein
MSLEKIGAALTVIILLISSKAWSQSYAESALQFGRTSSPGSARIQALGGAQIALGGDYSSAYSNPAGLGLYNKSEITLSNGLSFLTSNASYLNNNDEELKPKLTIPGFSIVLHMPREDKEKYVGGTFAISMSRINDFNQSTFYHGRTSNKDPFSSIIDSFIYLADGDDDSQFNEGNYQYNTPTGLAYYNYLIGPKSLVDQNGPDDEYFSPVEVDSYPDQQEKIQTKGATNQWNFSYGGNFKDRLFFGIGIGLTSLNYKSSKVYSEDFNGDPYLNYLTLQENLSVKGSGINATIGITARPFNFMQIGTSLTTPTVYQLTEKYDADMSTSWKDFDYYGDGSKFLNDEYAYTDIVTSNYSLTTPLKLSGGIAFICKYGLITGDVDLVNQAKSRYNATTSDLSFSEDNNEIRSTYKRAVNLRVGAEFRYEILRIRAGYGVQGNNYKNEYDNNNKITSISGGAGVRFKHFFFDLAIVNSVGKNLYSPYVNSPVVDIKSSLTKGVLTAGFNF